VNISKTLPEVLHFPEQCLSPPLFSFCREQVDWGWAANSEEPPVYCHCFVKTYLLIDLNE